MTAGVGGGVYLDRRVGIGRAGGEGAVLSVGVEGGGRGGGEASQRRGGAGEDALQRRYLEDNMRGRGDRESLRGQQKEQQPGPCTEPEPEPGEQSNTEL